MKMSKALRGNRDLPQLESYAAAAATAGSASDYEHVIATVPLLYSNNPSGFADSSADNSMSIRYFNITWEAALTGAATNNFTLQLNQRRAGALLVNTTSSTAVAAAGSVQITVGAGAAVNCYVGQYLNISGGTGTAETVVVTAFDPVGNKITATFANTHSGTYNVVSAPLASVTYASGTNDSAWVSRQIKAYLNTVKPGDVITASRVSSNVTGLASPAGSFQIEWVSAGPQ